jgi:hypothetical protein
MKSKSILSISVLLLSSALLAKAQPGAMLAFSRNVTGTVTNNSERLGGCPTKVCTTNIVTFNHCYTNCYEKLVCTTNGGVVTCTNVLVCVVKCFTNTFPVITCTNEFLNPTTVNISQTLDGTIATDGCDELAGLSNAVFHASIYANLRTNDWRGTHFGSFKIISGTNVVAFGGLTGINGAGSHRGLEPCAICNHLEGTLQGQIVESGPLHGAKIQAAYAGNFMNVSCPSTNAPQGAVSLGIEGVVVIPCFTFFREGDPDSVLKQPMSSTTGQ